VRILHPANNFLTIHNSSLNTINSAYDLGFIFEENITISDQVSALSKSYSRTPLYLNFY